MPARFRAVRPPSTTRSVAVPWTWISRIRTSRSPGTSRRVSPRDSGPPRSVPVTTAPRPFTPKTRSMASVAGRADGSRSPSQARPARPAPRRARPRSCQTRRGPGLPARDVGASRSVTARTTAATRSGSTASILVTTAMPAETPSASSSARCSRVWARGPSSAATTSSAASISPAPTSMLPTSLSCPGTSTKSITVPSSSVEVRVPDVDRHPAPALLGQAVGVDAGQRAQQRGLAVIDVPGRADDDGHGTAASARPTASTSSPSWSGVHGPQVQHDPTVLDAADDGRRPVAERREHAGRRSPVEGEPDRRQCLAGERPAADGRAQLHDRGRAADPCGRVPPPAPARPRPSSRSSATRGCRSSRGRLGTARASARPLPS